MSIPEFAELLGTTAPTTRRLVKSGAVPSTTVTKGKRSYRRVARKDAESYLAEHGPFQPTRGRLPRATSSADAESCDRGNDGPIANLVDDVRRLQTAVSHIQDTLDRLVPSNTGTGNGPDAATTSSISGLTPPPTAGTLDSGSGSADQQARIVALEDALRLQRAVVAMNADIDGGRARTVSLLLEALAAAEVTDGKRREQARVLDEIVGLMTTPGHPGQP